MSMATITIEVDDATKAVDITVSGEDLAARIAHELVELAAPFMAGPAGVTKREVTPS